ncbi:hypothetical protein Aple_067800 [Acrocarpospora pleiomorpha]|uniref:Berberine/berberine-like domain-containing protein n=1 Tax=Acrocarpospora pleiomorpha TaxID=90975 RepID=A0A5M3XWD7_9ACTN|nr:hypothetical protein Aple_067800 [Acrocarpospora pleiomorpha]
MWEFSPDGRNLALVTERPVQLYDTATGRIHHRFATHRDWSDNFAAWPCFFHPQPLAEVKRRWDPENVFRLNQNVPPAG